MNKAASGSLAPLYMWAGGKTRLLKHYRGVWPDPYGYEGYVEPFFGGGAVFGWLARESPHLLRQVVVRDSNAELMGLLQEIRRDPSLFISRTERLGRGYLALNHADRKKWFYAQREHYWEKPTPWRLYLLMKTGFNGIWQTCKASSGLFGTPAGLLNHSRIDQLVPRDLIREWSRALQTAHITSGDFASTPVPVKTRCLIFLDPPYRDSFTTYGAVFGDEEQKRVCAWLRQQHEAGHTVILANRCVSGDSFFEDLLSDICDFHYIDVVYTAGRRKRTGDGFSAKPARELLAITRGSRLS